MLTAEQKLLLAIFGETMEGVYQPLKGSEPIAAIQQVLDTLSPRQQRVLKLRFGFEDGGCKTLKKVGDAFNVTGERIRQIEVKALRSLRQPVNSRKLKVFYECMLNRNGER